MRSASWEKERVREWKKNFPIRLLIGRDPPWVHKTKGIDKRINIWTVIYAMLKASHICYVDIHSRIISQLQYSVIGAYVHMKFNPQWVNSILLIPDDLKRNCVSRPGLHLFQKGHWPHTQPSNLYRSAKNWWFTINNLTIWHWTIWLCEILNRLTSEHAMAFNAANSVEFYCLLRFRWAAVSKFCASFVHTSFSKTRIFIET